MDDLCRIGIIVELVFVKVIVILFCYLALGLLPQRHHAVKGLQLAVGLIFLVFRFLLLVSRLDTVFLHHHLYRISDVIRILGHQTFYLISIQIFAVSLVISILFELQSYLSAVTILLSLRYGITVGAGGFPQICLLLAISSAEHADPVADHEGRVKANAELTYDIYLILVVHLRLEVERTALGDGTQVLFQLLSGHPHAIIDYLQCPVLSIGFYPDRKVISGYACVTLCQAVIIQLVYGVAGIGNKLSEEYLFMGIDRIDHQI